MANRDVSDTSERKYQCKFCPKRFTRSSVLTDHIRVHTGEKPFTCKVCSKSFSQLTNLNRHHKIHTKDQTSLIYPVIPFRNQTAVPSSSNSNQAGNIRTSVQLSSQNLTSFSNFLQIPSSNLEEDEIFALNQALSLNADDFEQQIQTSFESGNIGHANNPQNTHDAILVSDESQDSISFDQQITPNCSDVQPPRVELDLSGNMSLDSRKCFYNPLERNNSSFDLVLRAPSDELEIIDIKPDLSNIKLSPVNNTHINTTDSLNAALQCQSARQVDFADSRERNLNNIFETEQVPVESIQYFKSESQLCFDNNDLARVQVASNDFIPGSASGLKSINNSLPNLSLAAVPSSFPFENSHACIDSDRVSQNSHIESSVKICSGLGLSNIILLSPTSSVQSTSLQSSPLPHSIQKNQVAFNSDKKSISCDFDDGSNEDVFIKCESSLEKSLEEETIHQSQMEFDAAGKFAVEEVSENPSIVIESVCSLNDKDKPGLSAREELSENSQLSSLAVNHLEISDQHKPSSEVEVINLEDFSPKQMSDEQHDWSVPLVDIQEITTQKLKPNLPSTKIWDIGHFETDSRKPLLELTPNFQQTTNNDAKNIPDLPNHVVSLEPSCFSCNCCKKEFPDKSTLLSHLCSPSKSLHSSKNPYSPLAEDVAQIHLKPHSQLSDMACQTAANSLNLTQSHLSQTEKLTCKYCYKHFSEISLLVKHIETHLDNIASMCDLCRQPFSQLTNLKNQERKQHLRNGLLDCQFCERTFPRSFQLLNHLKYHARSIKQNITALEDKIRQKQREKFSKKSLKASTNPKYLKKKSKSLQLSKKNVNQPNGINSLIPDLHLKRSHSDPQFNAISPKNDENLNPKDLFNKEMKKRPIGLKCLNSIEVSGNLTRNTSYDSFVENSSARECVNLSRSYRQEESVNEIEFLFSVKPSEDQSNVNTDSGSCTEQFRSANNSSNILKNSKLEAANKSLQNNMVQIQPSEFGSYIEYRENFPQRDVLPTVSSSPVLPKAYSRDHTTSPDDKLLQTDLNSMQSGFDSVDVTATAVNSQNISGDENVSEIIFVTSNSAAEAPDQSTPSNAPEKSGGQFHCKVCNNSFNRKFVLIKHLQTHTEEKPFKCEFCRRSFSQSSNLSRHRKTHLLFPCKFCPTKHQSISELNAHHQKLHMGMKSYICKFCSKTFSRSSVLKEHIRTHTGEKPFVCELCNRAFSQATNLNRHMKVHVPGRVFRCRYCSHTFKQYWHLKRHLKTHIHFGRMSNEDVLIRKTKRQPSIPQIIPGRTKPLKSNDFICKLSESNEQKLTRRAKSLQKKTENPESKQDSVCVTGSYEPVTFPDLLQANSFQHCSNIQPYVETLPNITGTPEILAINGQLLPATNNSSLSQFEIQSVATPTGLVPNICHESFQTSHVSSENGDDFLHNKVPSNYPLLLTTGQNQIITNESSHSFGLVNNSESSTKHNVFSSVNAERNNDNAFVNPDCKSLREADDANDDNESKDNSRSDIELVKNYPNNRAGIFWRAAHENQVTTNSRSKDLFIDNYETVRESLEKEDATTLLDPVHSLSVNVKLEPMVVNIDQQSGSSLKTSNSDSLHRNPSVVPFKEYRCTYCNKLFHHSQVLSRHLRSHHKSEMMKTSTCQLCHTSFPDSDALNRHRKTCSQLLLPYFCNLCKEKFPNSSELSRHRQRKHSGGIKRYPCCYCTKVFTRNSVLTEHIRTHTGEKPYVCELCHRAFSQATNLKRHQKIHARNGSYVCKYCQASFSKLSFLSRHLRMHAEERKHQDSATEGCQLENRTAAPFLKEMEKFSNGIKISENPRNEQKRMDSRTSLFTTKDSAIVHIVPGTLTETLTNNDFNKSFKTTLSNISQRQEDQLQNYETENNSEPVPMQDQLHKTLVLSDMRSGFSQTLQFGQIDTTMEGPGVCYSSLERDADEKSRETQKDNLSVNVAGRTQGLVTSSVPIIFPQTHFPDPVSPNFFEQQKGKECLELSNQPLIDIDLSIVKREENQSGSCSPRSGDQQNFQLYDSSNILGQQTVSSISQNPDLKPITPNIEIHRFSPDLITPAGREQGAAINKPYQSPKCSLVFAMQEQHNHISTHSETITKTSINKANQSYSCKFCKLRFTTSRLLFHHEKLKHPLMKCHQCKYCGRFFARTTVLTEHIRTHTGEKPFVCNVCNRAFSQMTNLKRHQKIHNRKSTICRYCKAVFTDYALLLKHLQSHGKSQDKIPKSLKSDVPAASSNIYARISQRIKNMAPKSGRVNFQNRKCTTPAKFPLNQHQSRLSNNKPSFVIDHEDEQIFTPASSTHSRSFDNQDSGSPSNYFHHQNETILSQISTWPWKTSLPSKIKSIPKSITSKFSEQTFWPNPLVSECDELQMMKPKGGQIKDTDHCIIPETSGSQLSRLTDFSAHISQSASLNDTKKYSCRYCKKIFLELNDLRTHSPCHGGEKRYQCKYCSKTFGRLSVLKQHIRIHTGEKPFKCDQCLQCFTQSSNLMRHMKLHRAENQISKNFDSKKKSHFRPFSHGFHKQLGYYGKSTFRKYNNKKSIPLKQLERNAQNQYAGESGQKNIFPPFSNLMYPSTTSQLSSITSQSHHDSLQTASKESLLIDPGNTMYDTTAIAPELNSNTDDSLIVLSSRGKKTDTIYLQINEENQSKVPPQTGSPTRTTDTNFMPAVETSSHSTKVSFSIKAEIAANKEPMPSDRYGSNNYNQSIKNSRIEASTPRTEHTKPAKKMHVCKICKEGFANRWKLSSHFKSHSKILFQCTFCEKGFTRSSVLKEHIRTHTGEKPYKCIHCQRSFSQMTNLKRHLKVHNRHPQTAMSHSLTI